MVKPSKRTVKNVSLDLIDEPRGILRMDINPEDLEDLAQSISEIGLLQDILLAVDGERFEIVFGHRRFLAHKQLGLLTIRAIVRTMTQEEIGIARATENISRKDLTPIEEAATYKNLLDEYSLSLEQIAKKMAKSPGVIKRRMDLLKMPPILQKAVHKKQISIAVAEELWPISDPADLDYYLSFALEGGCTKEVARSWCKDWRDTKRRTASNGEPTPSQLAPNEPRPIYVTCDLCLGAVELGKEIVLRICPNCFEVIKNVK